jgi:hypothetical protein
MKQHDCSSKSSKECRVHIPKVKSFEMLLHIFAAHLLDLVSTGNAGE